MDMSNQQRFAKKHHENQVELVAARDYPYRVMQLLDDGWLCVSSGSYPRGPEMTSVLSLWREKLYEREPFLLREVDVLLTTMCCIDGDCYEATWVPPEVQVWPRTLCMPELDGLVCGPLPWSPSRHTWWYPRIVLQEYQRLAGSAGAEANLVRKVRHALLDGLYAGQAMQLRGVLQQFGGLAARLVSAELEELIWSQPQRAVKTRSPKRQARLVQRLIGELQFPSMFIPETRVLAAATANDIRDDYLPF